MRRWMVLGGAAVLVMTLTAGCGDDMGDDETAAGGAGASSQTTMGSMGNMGQTATTSAGAGHVDHMGNPTADCSPSGNRVTITASNTSFDKNCLAAPASQAFTITYDNKDPLAHNIAILESHTATDVLFRADIFQGPKVQTFNVGALRPGVYAFHCEVHPGKMSGTFVVK